MDDHPKCDRIITYDNKTAVIPGYEGIPQNLLINAVAWLILLVMFTFLRKNAWDYGRIALTKPKKNKWASLFYTNIQAGSTGDGGSHESVDMQYTVHDYGYLSWIRACFTLKDADIENKAGIDAVHYLRFHFYLIIFSAFVMVGSLAIILPMNIHGNLKSPDFQSFGVTTISNIAADSPMLWGHLILGLFFFGLAFALMQYFSKQIWRNRLPRKTNSQCTLMISGISRSNCHKPYIKRHFDESFPNVGIEDVQVCYDLRKLIDLDMKRQEAELSVQVCQERFELKNKRPTMIPRCCGRMCKLCYTTGRCGCCFTNSPTVDDDGGGRSNACCVDCLCPAPVDAIDYYTNESEKLSVQIVQESKDAVRNKIGIAFVTFRTPEDADYVYRAYHHMGCVKLPPVSSLSAQLRSSSWTLEYAPKPDDIIWSNLSLKRTVWWLRAFAVNSCVFLVVFFLTTPTYVLNLINDHQLPKRLRIDNSLVTQFLPSIILWSVSALLPLLVYNSDILVGHWTRSNQHLIVMAKTFTLLILMVLILPSLGLTSVSALMQWLIPISNNTISPTEPPSPGNTGILLTTEVTHIIPQAFQWECVFMPDNGAFFVNYVITSAFIGNAMQLMRLPELFLFVCRLMCVQSPAEKLNVRKAIQYEFDFGLSYAWNLCMFSVISAYSLLCPLITPFGFLWLICRYLVDRYNLYFAYLPSRIDSRIHWLAMNFMLFAVLLLPLNLLMFFLIRFDVVGRVLSMTAVIGLITCLILWLVNGIYGWIYLRSVRWQPLLTDPDSNEVMLPRYVDGAPADSVATGLNETELNGHQSPIFVSLDEQLIPVVDTQFYNPGVDRTNVQRSATHIGTSGHERPFVAPILRHLSQRSEVIHLESETAGEWTT